jgi:hypothetical protein
LRALGSGRRYKHHRAAQQLRYKFLHRASPPIAKDLPRPPRTHAERVVQPL